MRRNGLNNGNQILWKLIIGNLIIKLISLAMIAMELKEEECCARLSPTDAEVEKVFKYSANGKISAVRNRPSSNVAQDMIHNLGLDSFHLERDRKQAIQASEVFDDEDYTDDEIRSFIEYYGSITNLMGFRIPHIINSAHINEF